MPKLALTSNTEPRPFWMFHGSPEVQESLVANMLGASGSSLLAWPASLARCSEIH